MSHDHGHSQLGSFAVPFHLDIRLFPRPQDHRIAVSVFDAALVPGRGLLALGIRWQLALPWSNMPVIGPMLFSGEGGQISPEFYTMLFTMHATVMIFFVIIPDSRRALRQLPDPADDRRGRHGVSHAEHAQLLVHVAGLHLHRD